MRPPLTSSFVLKRVRIVIRTPPNPVDEGRGFWGVSIERKFSMIEREIDYIQFSVTIPEYHCIERQYKTLPPLEFYKRGYEDENGFRLYFGNPNSDKALVIASGETLQSLFNLGWTSQTVADLALRNDGKVTRLDLAITEWISEDFITLNDIENWAKYDLIESPLMAYGAKKIEAITGNKTIETIYVGDPKKRGKRGIFRGYDRGIVMDLAPYLVTRLELEERGENAHNSTKRIANGLGIGSVFRSRFNVLAANFERVIESEAAIVQRGETVKKRVSNEALDNRWIWLNKQVAPALKNAIAEDRKLGLKSNRLYWFLRESGFDHDAIILLLQVRID